MYSCPPILTSSLSSTIRTRLEKRIWMDLRNCNCSLIVRKQILKEVLQ